MDQMTAIKARKRWFDGLKTIDKLRTEYAFAASDIDYLLSEIGRLEAALEIAEKCTLD